jgi:hypothetical protein
MLTQEEEYKKDRKKNIKKMLDRIKQINYNE